MRLQCLLKWQDVFAGGIKHLLHVNDYLSQEQYESGSLQPIALRSFVLRAFQIAQCCRVE